MINLIIGFILGISVATVGVAGVTSFVDTQLDNVKVIIKDNVK
jgi:hypothetical protein